MLKSYGGGTSARVSSSVGVQGRARYGVPDSLCVADVEFFFFSLAVNFTAYHATDTYTICIILALVLGAGFLLCVLSQDVDDEDNENFDALDPMEMIEDVECDVKEMSSASSQTASSSSYSSSQSSSGSESSQRSKQTRSFRFRSMWQVVVDFRVVNRLLHGWLLAQISSADSHDSVAIDVFTSSTSSNLCQFFLSRVNAYGPNIMRTRHRIVAAFDDKCPNRIVGVHLMGFNITVLPTDLQQVRLALQGAVIDEFHLLETEWQQLQLQGTKVTV